MRISLHQPNYFPTLAYFEKIRQVDLFVIIRHCQFEKGNYQNRFNMNGEWHTMSVNSGSKDLISQKKYVNPEVDWKRIKQNLSQYDHILSRFDHFINEELDLTNIGIVVEICRLLDIHTIIDYDFKTEKKGTERLVEICKHYNATTYLSGSSGKKYLNLDLFRNENIEVEYQTGQNYEPIIKTLDKLNFK